MTHNRDVEEQSSNGQRTPLLSSSPRQRIANDPKEDNWNATNVLQFFGGGIYAPDPSTYDPIEILLNTENGEEQDELTKRWRDNKLSELSFVGVVVCSCSILFTFRASPSSNLDTLMRNNTDYASLHYWREC